MAFDKKDLEKYSKFANLEDFEEGQLAEIRRKFEKNGTISILDFSTILYWKSNRTKSGILKTIKNREVSVTSLFSRVSAENDRTKKVEILLEIKGRKKNGEKGIGIPIASAILAVLYPKDYSICDKRVWDTLRESEYMEKFVHKPNTPANYMKFNEKLKEIANENCKSRRELDNYLWGKNLCKELENEIKKLELTD
ncbi:MAG: hypothetical protein N3E51_05275 [Candidatus Micrarchaeota archaeon]|nr:hypothetical protein [Candidatus Micrarchaeota archaeon]